MGIRVLGLRCRLHTTHPLGLGEGFSPYTLYPNPSTVSGSAREYIWQPHESVGSSIYLVRAKIGDETVTKNARCPDWLVPESSILYGIANYSFSVLHCLFAAFLHYEPINSDNNPFAVWRRFSASS